MPKLNMTGLPHNEWLDGRLFIHEHGFFATARGRSRWLFFLPGWVAFCGDTDYNTDKMFAIPWMFWTLKGARKSLDKIHKETLAVTNLLLEQVEN